MKSHIKIGKYNTLKVGRLVDFGAYLDGGDGTEVLLPAKYITEPLKPGDEVRVFVYTDSDDRPVATTEHPYATAGEFAFLQVNDVNRYGAFLDWGLIAKELLVPFSEQRAKLARGMVVPVYVYLDDNTKRVVASCKIEKFIGNTIPYYKRGFKVKALVYDRNEVGYKVIVDNLHHGIIYENELYKPLVIGSTVDAYVKHVRPDCKIDLLLHGGDDHRVDELAEAVLDRLAGEPGGYYPLTDSSSPEAIKAAFACSKKDFKKAIGSLYRRRLITIHDDGIKLVTE
ncbi:MAG: GntR family transcriptional regulator [Duncaniella sp.]|nr:GntR family transcriptional regulator [Duncaniella sp.]